MTATVPMEAGRLHTTTPTVNQVTRWATGFTVRRAVSVVGLRVYSLGAIAAATVGIADDFAFADPIPWLGQCAQPAMAANAIADVLFAGSGFPGPVALIPGVTYRLILGPGVPTSTSPATPSGAVLALTSSHTGPGPNFTATGTSSQFPVPGLLVPRTFETPPGDDQLLAIPRARIVVVPVPEGVGGAPRPTVGQIWPRGMGS